MGSRCSVYRALRPANDNPLWPPIFDEAWYISEYKLESAIAGRYANGYEHFLSEGASKGCNPSPLFDETWYRRQYPEVAVAIQSGLILSGYHDFINRKPDTERNPGPYFDVQWYRAKYNVPAGGDRLSYFEYLTSSAKLGRDPSAHFEEIWYRAANTGASGAIRSGKYPSAYHHYLYEGARLNWAPNPYFVPEWYVSWYTHAARERAFEHYLIEGIAQGLSPNLYFDELWYLNNNPDVEKAVEERADLFRASTFLGVGRKRGPPWLAFIRWGVVCTAFS